MSLIRSTIEIKKLVSSHGDEVNFWRNRDNKHVMWEKGEQFNMKLDGSGMEEQHKSRKTVIRSLKYQVGICIIP